jgi:hypothetical protein
MTFPLKRGRPEGRPVSELFQTGNNRQEWNTDDQQSQTIQDSKNHHWTISFSPSCKMPGPCGPGF